MKKSSPIINPLIEKYGESARWINWRLQTVKGKQTKIPYQSDLTHNADSTDPATWTTYAESIKASSNVGIVFTADQTLLGIDIDHCLTIDQSTGLPTWDHPEKDTIIAFLNAADSYVEISPSNTGLHIFLALTASLALTAHKHAPYEVYTSGRYFTFTGNIFQVAKPVRTVTPEEALFLIEMLGYPWSKKSLLTNSEEISSKLAGSSSISSLTDEEVLKKMFSSKKNGASIRSLYEGDISAHNNDASSADMALLSHLAFWTARNTSQMERLWLNSPLGKREKTHARKDYRDRTISAAIASCTTVYEPPEPRLSPSDTKAATDIGLMFIKRNKEKIFLENVENLCRIFRRHPLFKDRVRFDTFRNLYEVRDAPLSLSDTRARPWRPMRDNDAIGMQCEISIEFIYFAKVSKTMVFDAMVKVADENTIDSALDYVTSLVWDEKPRLDDWLSSVYGVKKSAYHRSVGSNWMKGLVKRIIEPGCQFDYVLVLEGEQGIKKSTSLAILGGQWYVETTMNTDTKDFFMQFAGKAIIEFSEGETLNRTEVKRMKAIITTKVDTFRPPYGRVSVDTPRRCVFAMTTNQDQYLKDETGNRRWLPVTCTKTADVEWLRENRDQLFAEAYHRVHDLKETTYEFPEEETRREQEMRQATDPREEIIYEWLFMVLTPYELEQGITTRDAYDLGVRKGQPFGPEMSRIDEMIIGQILRKNLKMERRRMMADGTRFYRYFVTEETLAMAPIEKISAKGKKQIPVMHEEDFRDFDK